MWEVYEGDLLLFTVDTEYEANEARAQGFQVVHYMQGELDHEFARSQ
jgi:hypothetical protein